MDLMRTWYENHNNATDKTPTKTDGRIHMITGGETSPSACRCCGNKDHEKASCPLILNKKKIFYKNHPGMDSSHTTAACMNPGGPGGSNPPPSRGRGGRGKS